jgi:hypothetical protein
MAKGKSSTTIGLSPRLILAIAVIAGFSAAGIYSLIKSKAASYSPDLVIYSNRGYANNHLLNTLIDNVPYVGNQYITQLSPGASETFSFGGPDANPVANRYCYVMRAVSISVNATITAGANKMNVVVPVSKHAYQNYCVTYTYGAGPGYSVKNNSGGYLKIYQARYHYTSSNSATW